MHEHQGREHKKVDLQKRKDIRAKTKPMETREFNRGIGRDDGNLAEK